MSSQAEPPARPFDPSVGYTLAPAVALRPEAFGALAYNYVNRRLTFLRSPDLVSLVEDLEHHPSVDDALARSTVPASRWPSFRNALAILAEAGVIHVR